MIDKRKAIMALKVWLPLNGNFRNQGLDGDIINFTETGTINDVNGKIGLCKQFSSSNAIASYSFSLPNSLSICVWAKWTAFPSSSSNDWVLDLASTSGYDNAAVGLSVYHGTFLCVMVGGKSDYTYTHNFSLNTWYHIAFTWDGAIGNLYVNGELKKSYTNLTGGTVTSGNKISIASNVANSSTKFKGCLNDVRIYDNCLSADDVKEVYRTKIYDFAPQWIRLTHQDHDSGGDYFTKNNINACDASGIYRLTSRQQFSDDLFRVNGVMPLASNFFPITAKTNGSMVFVLRNGFAFSGLTFDGPRSISIWTYPAGRSAPSASEIIYFDPVAKMVVGFLSGGAILTAANGNAARFTFRGMSWGGRSPMNIIATWDENKQPVACYLNGAAGITGSTTSWDNTGTVGAIGYRCDGNAACTYSGTINTIRVYSTLLSLSDAKEIYARGEDDNEWLERATIWKDWTIEDTSGATWIRVLHHNNPAANLFTTANRTNNEADNLFSKLYLYSGSTIMRRNDGTYEFMAREKITTTGTVQTFRWKQTSNPTASTCTGYQLISQTTNPGRSFGLSSGPTDKTFFSNNATWWCACGCNGAYQGGIPGFGGVVTNGYVDLYARIDRTNFNRKEGSGGIPII